jgi:hypothetical protein
MGGVGSSARRGEWGGAGERGGPCAARGRGGGKLGPESAQPGGGRREIPFSFFFSYFQIYFSFFFSKIYFFF